MAIVFRTSNSVSNANGGSTTKTVNAPASIALNDLLIAIVYTGSSTNVTTPPTGWTAGAGTAPSISGRDHSYLYWLVAGGSEPSTYSWVMSATTYTDIGIFRYDGEDTTSAADAYTPSTAAAPTTTPTATGLTTGRANNLVVCAFDDINASLGTTTPPSGFTERLKWDNAAVLNDAIQATAAATGNLQETTTGSGGFCCHVASFNAPSSDTFPAGYQSLARPPQSTLIRM